MEHMGRTSECLEALVSSPELLCSRLALLHPRMRCLSCSLNNEPGHRRETRVFAHAAAETQSTIYDSITSPGRPGTTSGRPGTSSHGPPGQDTGFLEVRPRITMS